MDIVLEVLDTFLFDHLYAAALPAKPAPYDLLQNGSFNATSNATSFAELSPWQYKPATSFFSLEPGNAAYASAWTRDNPYRQALTLFLITWLVPHHMPCQILV